MGDTQTRQDGRRKKSGRLPAGREFYTEMEREYHKAYPDTRFLWTLGAFFGLFGRYGRGFLLWGLAGVAFAAALWALYALVAPIR